MCMTLESQTDLTLEEAVDLEDCYRRPRYPGTDFVYRQVAVFTPTIHFQVWENRLVDYCGGLRTRETWPKLIVLPEGRPVNHALDEIAAQIFAGMLATVAKPQNISESDYPRQCNPFFDVELAHLVYDARGGNVLNEIPEKATFHPRVGG